MIIFNELEYAENMLKRGFLQDKYSMELKILAKYYNKKKDLKTNDIKVKLKEFCKKYLTGYNEILHLDMITTATTFGVQKKNVLVVIPPIPITKNELEKIKELNDLDLEKLSFVALVLSKINKHIPKNTNSKYKKKENIDNQGYYVNNLKDLFTCSKITCNKTRKDIFIEQLHETKLFGFTIFCTLEVNFVDEISEPEIIIKNFDNFILEYLKYIGHNIAHCLNCEIPFATSNSTHKYCKICAKEIYNEQEKNNAKLRMRKMRNKNVTQTEYLINP